EAGLLRGAYHYLDYSQPGADQADYFASLLQSDPGELPPVVDYEQTRSDNNPAIALQFLKAFLNRLKERQELFQDSRYKVPMIYTAPYFWSLYGDQTDREYWLQFPLWLAHWTTASAPQVPAPWPMWTFWQFTSKGPGEVFGAESLAIDMNRYNGTLKELLEFAGLREPSGTLVEVCEGLERRLDAVEQKTEELFAIGQVDVVEELSGLKNAFSSFVETQTALHNEIAQRLSSLEYRLSSGSSGNFSNDTPPSSNGNDRYARCNVGALNVRSGPGTSYKIVTTLRLGQRVKVLNRQNGWAQLEQPAGWVYEGYLSYEQNNPAPPSGNSSVYGICNTGRLNVRSGPGTSHPIVGSLTYGQRVKILERRNGWARLESPAGWCYEGYLSF
ncbi:MAG: SH3 domain-containing protein, partial [Anaerolineales bacterium]|nr:SH3 domain-containing protein [Anaerolineales bacterium]